MLESWLHGLTRAATMGTPKASTQDFAGAAACGARAAEMGERLLRTEGAEEESDVVKMLSDKQRRLGLLLLSFGGLPLWLGWGQPIGCGLVRERQYVVGGRSYGRR